MKKSFEKSSSWTWKVLRTLAGCLMIAMLVGLIPGRTVLAEEEKTISSKKVTYQKRDDGRGIRGNMSFEEFLSDGFKELVNEQVTVTLVWDDGSTSILDPSMYDIVLFCYAADEEDSIYLPDMYLKDIDEEAVNTLRSYAEYDYFDITFGIMTNDSFCYDNRWIVDGSTIEWTKLYEEDDINTLIKSGNIGERSMVENRIDMAGENPYLYLDFVLTDPKRGKEFRAEDCEITYYDRVTEEKITADFLGPGYYTMKVSIPGGVYSGVLKRSFDLYCDHDYSDSWVTEWTDLVPATDKEDGYGHKKVWCRYCRTVKYDKMATIGKVSECSISPARKTFDGETVNPEDIHVYAYGSDMKNENGSVTAHMKYGEDYTVTFPDGMKEIGAYPVIFTGMGKYDFRITIYFEIVPETPCVEAHNAASGIKVTWSEPVNEISGYYIYKRTYSGKYSKIKTINDISVRSYIDTDVLPGVDYVYTVRAFWKDSSGRAVLSGYAGDGERCLNTPSVDVSFGANGPSVTWNKISGARRYFVYRKESGAAKWKKIAEVESELSYTDTAAVIGKEYYYTVRAYYYNYNFYHESMSAYKSSEKLTCLSCPAVTIANAATGVKVSYDKIAGANGYYIYRKVSGGSYRKVKEITNGSTVSWTDTGAASGTNYVYTVKACYKDGESGKVATSTYKGSNTLKYLKCPSVTLSRLSTGIKVSWDKVGGAASYRVYRKQEGAASWTRIKDISNGTTVSYTDTTARKGVKYYYTVRALNGSYISAYVTNKSITR